MRDSELVKMDAYRQRTKTEFVFVFRYRGEPFYLFVMVAMRVVGKARSEKKWGDWVLRYHVPHLDGRHAALGAAHGQPLPAQPAAVRRARPRRRCRCLHAQHHVPRVAV